MYYYGAPGPLRCGQAAQSLQGPRSYTPPPVIMFHKFIFDCLNVTTY